MSCNFFSFFTKEIWPFFNKKKAVCVPTRDVQTQTRKKKRKKTPYKTVVIKPVQKKTEKTQTIKYKREKYNDGYKTPKKVKSNKNIMQQREIDEANRKTETCTLINLGDEERSLQKLYLRDDNFLILNPNFKSSNDSLTSNVHYSSNLDDHDSYNTRLEKILKKKCKYRLMGDEKCACRLCSTLAVIRESLKHTGPFDWEFTNSKPSFSQATKGKYVNTSRYTTSINGLKKGHEIKEDPDKFDGYDLENLLCVRLEEKINNLTKKLSEMDKSKTNFDKPCIIKGSTTSVFSYNVHQKLTFKNVKFYAEGTMDILGKPKSRRKKSIHTSSLSNIGS